MKKSELKKMCESQCFYEGMDAFLYGQPNNPHTKDSTSYSEWQDGYDYAELCQTSLCTKITFADQGQRFLEWYINYGNIVIDSQPEGDQWIGSKVQTLSLSAGKQINVVTRINKEVMLTVPIIKIEPLTNEEYSKVGQSYKKWLEKIDQDALISKATFSGKLIAETQNNEKLLSIYLLEKGSTQYVCVVKDRHDSLLSYEPCNTNEEIVRFLGFTDPALNLYCASGLFSEQELDDLVELNRDGHVYST